jgi:hypothetical protein
VDAAQSAPVTPLARGLWPASAYLSRRDGSAFLPLDGPACASGGQVHATAASLEAVAGTAPDSVAQCAYGGSLRGRHLGGHHGHGEVGGRYWV